MRNTSIRDVTRDAAWSTNQRAVSYLPVPGVQHTKGTKTGDIEPDIASLVEPIMLVLNACHTHGLASHVMQISGYSQVGFFFSET